MNDNIFILFLTFLVRPETLAAFVSVLLPLIYDYLFAWAGGSEGLPAGTKRAVSFMLTALISTLVYLLAAHLDPTLVGDQTLEAFAVAVYSVVLGQLAHPVWSLLGVKRLDQ
jgi:hypothetical protein